MKKTYSQRILDYLVNNEGQTFTKSVAKNRFRKIDDIHGTIMRTARKMEENGLLRRVAPGEFEITRTGKNFASF